MKSELAEEIKFFFRYLKENGIYIAYLKNIRNPNCYGFYQRFTYPWSIGRCARLYGTSKLIASMMHWDGTPEGSNFWVKKHMDFKKLFFEKYGHE